LGQFSKNFRTFYPKICKLSKIWVWDPGSGKNPFRIPDPGSRGKKGTGSRIRNTGISSWSIVLFSTNQFFVMGGEEQVRPVRLGPPNQSFVDWENSESRVEREFKGEERILQQTRVVSWYRSTSS
jgi:hypothetical protein